MRRNSFTYSVSTLESFLCGGHPFRFWGYNSKQNRVIPIVTEFTFWWGKAYTVWGRSRFTVVSMWNRVYSCVIMYSLLHYFPYEHIYVKKYTCKYIRICVYTYVYIQKICMYMPLTILWWLTCLTCDDRHVCVCVCVCVCITMTSCHGSVRVRSIMYLKPIARSLAHSGTEHMITFIASGERFFLRKYFVSWYLGEAKLVLWI